MDDEVQNKFAHERELLKQWQLAHENIHTMGSLDLERRLDVANKFREQIMEERGQFVPRVVYDEQHNALRDAVDIRLKILEQNKSNMEGRMWAMGAGVTILTGGLTLLLHFIGK